MMSISIAGHKLTKNEIKVLDIVRAYLREHAGDSSLSETTSPCGDGRQIPVREIFPVGNADAANRRTLNRLAAIGVLRACEIDFNFGNLKAEPFRNIERTFTKAP